MNDADALLRILDGSIPPQPQNLRVAEDPSGNLGYQMVLRTNGAQTSTGNPQPVADGVAATALGTPADAPYGGTGTASVIAALKAIAGETAPMAYSGAPAGTAQLTSGRLVQAGTYTRTFTITTLPSSTSNVWLNPNGAAAVNEWGFVAAGGGSFTFGTKSYPLPVGDLMAITDGVSPQTVLISGG